MRTTQQRLEEIRRRSKIYIEKRNKRRKLLVSVVSSGLCVCLCLGAVFLLNKDRAGEDKYTGAAGGTHAAVWDEAPAGNVQENAPNASPEDMAGSLPQASSPQLDGTVPAPEYGIGLRALEVTAGALSSCSFDSAILTQTADFLSALVFESRVTGGSGLSDASQAPDCAFALTYTNGSRTEYTLTGTCLKNTASGDFVHLTATQLSRLQTLLGLT